MNKNEQGFDQKEREYKELIKEVSNKDLHLEAIDRQRNDIMQKYKECEKRIFDLYREKSEMESSLRIAQIQLEDMSQENEQIKKAFERVED